MPSTAHNRPGLTSDDIWQHVVAAAICKDDTVLIAQRAEHLHQGGKWEFPGGKVEDNETATDALRRELQEELGITPTLMEPLIKVRHAYPEKHVLLDVWYVSEFTGCAHSREQQQIRWVSVGELERYTFPDANRAIIRALSLPPVYLITPEFDGLLKPFLAHLEHALQGDVRLVQLRSKNIDTTEFARLARMVVDLCHRHEVRVLLNAALKTMENLGADGIHLSSMELLQLSARPLPHDRLIAASCHNEQELVKANQIDADFVVISPVQATQSHPDAEPLGWQIFSQLSEIATVPVYALGGLTMKDLPKAKQHGAQGIAAIRNLWPD